MITVEMMTGLWDSGFSKNCLKKLRKYRRNTELNSFAYNTMCVCVPVCVLVGMCASIFTPCQMHTALECIHCIPAYKTESITKHTAHSNETHFLVEPIRFLCVALCVVYISRFDLFKNWKRLARTRTHTHTQSKDGSCLQKCNGRKFNVFEFQSMLYVYVCVCEKHKQDPFNISRCLSRHKQMKINTRHRHTHTHIRLCTHTCKQRNELTSNPWFITTNIVVVWYLFFFLQTKCIPFAFVSSEWRGIMDRRWCNENDNYISIRTNTITIMVH